MNKKQQKILTEYEDQRPIYEEFTNYCKNELYEFIKETNLDHLLDNIAYRTKQVVSFSQKMQDGFYPKNLAEVRDLSGIRAIFYIESAISSFFGQIVSNKKIRDLECVEFIRGYRPPRFLGQYVILKISPEKIACSPELKKFEGYLCELQLTDTLQNAWANIYHQTIYKNKKKLEKDFPKEVEIIDQRYESMIQGPLRETSNSINYLYSVGNKLLEGHKFLYEDISQQLAECTSLNQVWELLHRLNDHIRAFGLKFNDDEKILSSLEEIHHRLERFSISDNRNSSKWLFNDAIKKIASIACGLFYLFPERICDFFEVFIQQRPLHHQIIIEVLKALTGYDRFVSHDSYTQQLILARWISKACHQNRNAINVWLVLLKQLLAMELSGTSRSDVDTISIQRGILLYHVQLEEVRIICLNTLLSILKTESATMQRVLLIREILHAIRPSHYYEQLDSSHCKMYENELAVIVAYFSDFFDKMTLQELVAFDVEAAEIGYWFKKCELNTTPLETFLSSKFRSEEYLSMRIFVGQEHHKHLNKEERSNKLLALISDISSDNWNDWKRKICRVASMYPDLGYGGFDTFEEFLEILTSNKPELAIDLLRHHIVDLSWFSKILIPPLYHSVFQEEINSLLQNYIESKKELEGIVQGVAQMKPAPVGLVELLLDTLMHVSDAHSVFVLTCSLKRISGNWNQGKIKLVFFKSIEFLSTQRDFRWIEQVLYEKNPLIQSFETDDFKRISNLIMTADFIGPGVDYVLSRIAFKEPGSVLQFFVDRKTASKEYSSISIWPSDLKITKDVLARLSLYEMRSFYTILRASGESDYRDFIFRLLPQLMSLSAVSLLEFIDTIETDKKDLELILEILRQYPDKLKSFDYYEKIISKFELHPDQIDEICSQIMFVSETRGREDRLLTLQERKVLINSWSPKADQNSGMKKFLKRFNPAMDTAIKDEQVLVSRDLFVDIATFQDGVKQFEEASRRS